VWRVFDTSLRTRSIDVTIRAVKAALASQAGADAAAARDLVEGIRNRTNADRQDPLKYIRHLRNKWAGHASVDRDFDAWGDANSRVSLALIEKALEILVNAHQDLYEVIEMNEFLASTLKPPATTDSGGERSFAVDFDWSAVVPIAELVRKMSKRSATRLVERLALQ
jgi:hypothetical protein